MRTLLDTNILLRCLQLGHPMSSMANEAVERLSQAKRALCIGSQTIYEFLAVSTRPVPENGLGWNHADADGALDVLLSRFEVLFDSEAVSQEARRLILAHHVTGKKVHDCHLAATAAVYNVQEILTFNSADFQRYPHL